MTVVVDVNVDVRVVREVEVIVLSVEHVVLGVSASDSVSGVVIV